VPPLVGVAQGLQRSRLMMPRAEMGFGDVRHSASVRPGKQTNRLRRTLFVIPAKAGIQ
jgi:hypothetical protein